jgi:ketosteroid isomerase-like protein
MKKIATAIIPLTICLIALGCSGKYAGKSSTTAEKILFDTDVAFSRASEEKGPAEAFDMYLADEAIQLPASEEPIIGRQTIYESMKKAEGATLTWKPVKAEVSKSGDMGYTWGTYNVSYLGADGDIKTGYGKYLNVWKKQSNGEWKVLIDMGNSSPPPEENESE